MSDERLRELERQWKASGFLEDEVAYLRERIRVKKLSSKNLELSARCGHRPSRILLDEAGVSINYEGFHFLGHNLEQWLNVIGQHSAEALARSLVLILLSRYDTSSSNLSRYLLDSMLVVGDFVRWPRLDTLFLLDHVSRLLVRTMQGESPSTDSECVNDVHAIIFIISSLWSEYAPGVVKVAIRAFVESGWFDTTSETANYPIISDPELQSLIQTFHLDEVRRLLIPWLLGYGDPLHDRLKNLEETVHTVE